MKKCPFNKKSQQSCPWFHQSRCTFFTNIQAKTFSNEEKCFFEQNEQSDAIKTITVTKDCTNCLHWNHCKNEYKAIQVCGDYKSEKEYEYEIIKKFATRLKEEKGIPKNIVDNLVKNYN